MKETLKWIFVEVCSALSYLFRLFPVKRNRVFFSCFSGRNFTCSPKSISDFLLEKNPGEFEIIWAFRDQTKYKFLEGHGIKIVPYASLRRLFYECTAKVSVCNDVLLVPARKEQEHICTWHGGGAYKAVGLKDEGRNWAFEKRFLKSAKNTTLFLSNNHYFSRIILPDNFGYQGEILECGLPRNDKLVCNSFKNRCKVHEKVCDILHLPKDVQLILYAPTWRYDVKAKLPELDVANVLNALEKRFSRKAILLFRAHHISKTANPTNMIDVTSYPEMQELLLACDMLISDYSSCIWDFSFTYKPCILYTPDLEKYRQERGFVKDISEWHFPYYEDNASLIQGIENFDEEQFIAGMKQHHEDLGSCETGEATKTVCDYIYKICFGESEKEE